MRTAVMLAVGDNEWPAGPAAIPNGGGSNPITFPTVPLVLKAELLLGGVWVNITSFIYYETRVKIKRGRDNEANRAQPSKCSIRLKNPNRIWSPRNASGPYYGLLNRNVKLRISVNPGNGDIVRFTGYVSQWPQSWTTGQHRWVDLQAWGILKRLGQGKSALRAPIYRSVKAQKPYAYWTLTDASGSASAASEIVGGTPLTPTGNIAFAGVTDTPDSLPAVQINAGRLTGQPAPAKVTSTNGWMFSFGLKLKSVDFTTQYKPMITFNTNEFLSVWEIYPPTADAAFRMQVNLSDTFNTTNTTAVMTPLWTATDLVNLFDNKWHYFQIVTAQLPGPTQATRCYMDGVLTGIGATLPVSVGSSGAGRPTNININPQGFDWSTLNYALRDLSVIEVNTTTVSTNDGNAFQAFVGERPTDRFKRLCTEESIDAIVVETGVDTETMGAQAVDTLMNLLRECEAVNEGVMDEDLSGRLRLLSRTSTWNQPPKMIVDYAAPGSVGQIKPDFQPTDDDLLIQNDWAITRKGGNTRQFVQNTGPLNVQDPTVSANGVNRYDNSATLNTQTDDQAFQHAAWRVKRGTVDEMRIGRMPLHFSSTPNLLAAWLNMDVNAGFRIINTPTDMGNVPSWQTMTGYEEEFDRLEWKVWLYGAPASPDQIGILDGSGGRLDCSACALAGDLTTSTTAIPVAIADECTWVGTNLPFPVLMNGEIMQVTAVTVPVGAGTAWTQTLTVTRSINGVVKAHTLAQMNSVQKEIHVTEPFILAL